MAASDLLLYGIADDDVPTPFLRKCTDDVWLALLVADHEACVEALAAVIPANLWAALLRSFLCAIVSFQCT